jgi:hypothetical protein
MVRENTGGHPWKGKMGQSMAEFAARVTELEAACQDHRESGPGDDTHLA